MVGGLASRLRECIDKASHPQLKGAREPMCTQNLKAAADTDDRVVMGRYGMPMSTIDISVAGAAAR